MIYDIKGILEVSIDYINLHVCTERIKNHNLEY